MRRKWHTGRGYLTEAEWGEIVCLDYVLTWRFTDDYDGDLRRYRQLTRIRWGRKKL